MYTDPILDLFEVIIPRSGVISYWGYFLLLIRHAYITLSNIKFLGRPPGSVRPFLVSAYKDVFQKNFPPHYSFFYFLCGKRLAHIYHNNNQDIGFALFRSGPHGNIHLCSMGILKEFRGKGFGKFFLSESLAYWQKEGFKSSSLYVEEINVAAIRTYKSLGYQPVKHKTNMIFMVKAF